MANFTQNKPLLFLLPFTIFLSYRLSLPVLLDDSCHCLIPELVNILPTAFESKISGLNSQLFLCVYHHFPTLPLPGLIPSFQYLTCWPGQFSCWTMFAISVQECFCCPLHLLYTSFSHCPQCALSSLDLLHTFLLNLSPKMLPAFSLLSRSCIYCLFTLLPCSFSLVTLLVPLLFPACQTLLHSLPICSCHITCTFCLWLLLHFLASLVLLLTNSSQNSPCLQACSCNAAGLLPLPIGISAPDSLAACIWWLSRQQDSIPWWVDPGQQQNSHTASCLFLSQWGREEYKKNES